MVASVILFALASGARQGEILGCSWSDISLIDKMWRIPKEHSKSGKYRMVPLSPFAIEVLENITPKHDVHVFWNQRNGEKLKSVSKAFDRIRRETGFPKLKFHTLRHTFATYLLNSGEDIAHVSRILGHSSIAVTMKYSHSSQASLQSAASRAGDIISRAMHLNDWERQYRSNHVMDLGKDALQVGIFSVGWQRGACGWTAANDTGCVKTQIELQ